MEDPLLAYYRSQRRPHPGLRALHGVAVLCAVAEDVEWARRLSRRFLPRYWEVPRGMRRLMMLIGGWWLRAWRTRCRRRCVSYPFAEHVHALALGDLLGWGAGWWDWVEGEGADAGVGAVGGKRDAGAALYGVDRLVFSRLKPTSSPGRAGGGGGE